MVDIPGLKDPSETSTPAKKGFPAWGVMLVVAVLAVLAAIGLQLARQNAEQPRSGPAPDFVIDVYNSDAKFQLSEHKGKIIVLNFWGSWCAPCRDEAPLLQSAWETYQDEGVVVVGVGFRDTEPAALAFLDEFNITYPNGPDAGLRITQRYNVFAAPETFIIDQEGNIVDFFFGALPHDWLDEKIGELVAGTS